MLWVGFIAIGSAQSVMNATALSISLSLSA